MSQVKIPKFSGGGKTYGTYIRNGKEHIADEAFMGKFDEWLSNQSDNTQMALAGTRDQLLNGETVNHNSFANTLDSNMKVKNARQDRLMKRETSGFRQKMGETFGSRVAKNKRAITDAKSFNYKETPLKNIDLNFEGQYFLDYNKSKNADKDGKHTYTYSDSVPNNAAFDKIRKFYEYNPDDPDNKNTYTFKGLKYTPEEIRKLSSVADLDRVYKNARSNALTEDDLDFLEMWGVYYKDPSALTEEEKANKKKAEEKKAEEKKADEKKADEKKAEEIAKNIDELRSGFMKGEDLTGNWGTIGILKDGSGYDLSGLKKDVVHHFSQYSPVAEKSSLYGKYYYNGNLFDMDKKDEEMKTEEGAKRWGIFNGIMDDYNEDIVKTNNYAERFGHNYNWGKESMWNDYRDGSYGYYEFQKDIGKNRYADLSNNYVLKNNKDKMIVIEDGTDRDRSGRLTGRKYLYYDSETGTVKSLNEPPVNRLSKARSDRNGMVVKKNVAMSSKAGKGINLYDYALGEAGNFFFDSDGNIWGYRGKNSNKLAKVNPKYFSAIEQIANNGGAHITEKDWKEMFMSNLEEAWREEYTVPREIMAKEKGGRIEKHQTGGSLRGINGKNEEGYVPYEKIQPGLRNEKHTKIIGDGRGMTFADKALVASLVADIGSLGLSFVPGLNSAAAAAGLAGTGAAFVADWKRDGFQLGDLGNAALGVAFDGLTLIPGASAYAKSLKITKALKRFGKPLLNIMAMYGASNAAIMAIQKAQSGEEMTLDDWRTAVSGLTAVTGLGRQVGDMAKNYKAAGEIKSDYSKPFKDTEQTIEMGVVNKQRVQKDVKLTSEQMAKYSKTDGQIKDLKNRAANADATGTISDRNKFNKQADELEEQQREAVKKMMKKSGIDPTPANRKQFEKTLAAGGDGKTSFDYTINRNVDVKLKMSPEQMTAYNSTVDPIARRAILDEAYSQQFPGTKNLHPKGAVFVKKASTGNNKAEAYEIMGREYSVEGENLKPLSIGEKFAMATMPAWIQKRGISSGKMSRKATAEATAEATKSIDDLKKTIDDLEVARKDAKNIPSKQDAILKLDQARQELAIAERQLKDIQNPITRHARYEAILKQMPVNDSFAGLGAWMGGVVNPYFDNTSREALDERKGYYNADSNPYYNPYVRMRPISELSADYQNGGSIKKQGGYYRYSNEEIRQVINGIAAKSASFSNGELNKFSNGGIVPKKQVGGITSKNPLLPVWDFENNIANNKQFNTDFDFKKSDASKSPYVETKDGKTSANQGANSFTKSERNKKSLNVENLLNAAGLNIALRANDRYHDLSQKGIRALASGASKNVDEYYSRFSDQGIPAMYNLQAQNILNKNAASATSDPVMNRAFNNNAQMQADQSVLEGKIKSASLYDAFQDKTMGEKRSYAESRNRVANSNNLLGANIKSKVLMDQAAKVAQDATSIDRVLKDKQLQLNQDEQFRLNRTAYLDQVEMNMDIADKTKDLMNAYKAEYDEYNDTNADRPYASMDDWFADNPDKVAEYQKATAQVQLDAMKNKIDGSLKYYNTTDKNPGINGLRNLFGLFN